MAQYGVQMGGNGASKDSDFDKALESFRTALENPADGKGKWSEVRQRLLAIGPSDRRYWAAQEMLAWAYYQEADYAQALSRYRAFAERYPSPDSQWWLLQFLLADYPLHKAEADKLLDQISDPANGHPYAEEAAALKKAL